jgi:hypothetical protein
MQRSPIEILTAGPNDATIVDMDAAVFNSTLELREDDLLEVSSLVVPRDPPVFNPTLSLHGEDLIELRSVLEPPREAAALSGDGWELPRQSVVGAMLKLALPPLAVAGLVFAAVTISRDRTDTAVPHKIVTFGALHTASSSLAAASSERSEEAKQAPRPGQPQPVLKQQARTQPAAAARRRPRTVLSARQRRVVRRHLVLAKRAARQRRPAERPLSLAKERPDEQRHEPLETESVLDADKLGLPANVIAVVESDCPFSL